MKRKKRCLHCGFVRLIVAYDKDERMADSFKATCRECPTIDDTLIPKHYFTPSFRHCAKPAGPLVASPRTYVKHEVYVPPQTEYQRPDPSRAIKSYGALC